MDFIDRNYFSNRTPLAAAVDREQRRDIGCYPDEDDDFEEEDEERDPNLDPAFSSWDDFNRYMYG